MNNSPMEEYYQWVRSYICGQALSGYEILLRKLFDTEFVIFIPMDRNRASDGIHLRYRYCYENDIPYDEFMHICGNRPCSILEMMIALCIRVEEDIMSNPDYGDRTGEWFWNMVLSLGLGTMRDNRYDELYVDEVLRVFMMHEYQPNGKGSLVILSNPNIDARNEEIWRLMMLYLDEIVE